MQPTQMSPYERVREVYIKREGLFGVLSWDEVVKADSISRDLNIRCDKEPGNIYLFIGDKKIRLIPSKET